ncbi:MAG: 23S rRNA (guanosine(2251)-2'-O)-methyltransferase RlmB [Bacteroidia bacterium]|nr:23S rRNA (guanosine(2251)-2'-O)-methyltransferase RlmB [Bacteroidia bacterium]
MNTKKNNDTDTDLLIYGTRPIIEAIQSGKEIQKLFIQDGFKSDLIKELIQLAKTHKVYYQFVPVEKLNRLTKQNHQGVVAFLSEISFAPIESILASIYDKGEVPLLLMLDKVTDVRNFGAIARTAECCGVNAIIIPVRGSAPVNADAIKTSAGALHKIPVCRSMNLKETIQELKAAGIQVVACTEKAQQNYTSINMEVPVCIIMGSEEEGISPEYLKMADHKVKLPMKGNIASLNVSVACGVILYEVIRQRN